MTAVECDGSRWEAAEVSQRADQVAATLPPGQRVRLSLTDPLERVVGYWGILRAGAWVYQPVPGLPDPPLDGELGTLPTGPPAVGPRPGGGVLLQAPGADGQVRVVAYPADVLQAAARARADRRGCVPGTRLALALPTCFPLGHALLGLAQAARLTLVTSRRAPTRALLGSLAESCEWSVLVPALAALSPPGQRLLLASGHFPEGLVARLHRTWAEVRLAYGWLETQGPCLGLRASQFLADPARVGDPLPGVARRVCAGELQVRGPWLARPGWLATGEGATGERFTGRRAPLAFVRGEPISVVRLEQWLRDRGVQGPLRVELEDHGEELVLELPPQFDPVDLRQRVREELGINYVPRLVAPSPPAPGENR